MTVAIVFNHDVHALLETILVKDTIGQNVMNVYVIDPVPIIEESAVDLENLEVVLGFSCRWDLNGADRLLKSVTICI